jgi:O-6-methylguanine DNA methyltransferase
MISFTKMVFAACSRIPKGKVSTYGIIARVIGKPGASRAVGNALNKNRLASVPCHRVVRGDGTVGGFAGGTQKKMRILKKEGIEIENGRVKGFEKVKAQP